MTIAVLRRLDDEGTPIRIDLGEIDGAWWDVPLPPCPDCDGELEWAEAGHVPGARQCTGCGHLFLVDTETAE